VHMALKEVVALGRFKELMSKHGGKLQLRPMADMSLY